MSRTIDAGAFALTASARDYLPRPDTENALVELEGWVLNSATSFIWLTGPPGMGKSLLLKVLGERLAGQTLCVYVGYPMLSPRDLSAWVFAALGSAQGDIRSDSIVDLAAQRAEQGGLLLLIDDAMSMQPATQCVLDDWYRDSGGALRSVRAVTEIPTAIGATGSSGGDRVALEKPLSFDESMALLSAGMERSQLDAEVRAVFDSAMVHEIHESAGGVPTRLLIEADRVLFRHTMQVRRGPTEPLASAPDVEVLSTPSPTGQVPHQANQGQSSHVRSRRRRILAAVVGAVAAVATVMAVQFLADPARNVAPLATAHMPDRGESPVATGAGSIEFDTDAPSNGSETPAPNTTHLGGLAPAELQTDRTPASTPMPLVLPDVAASPPGAPAPSHSTVSAASASGVASDSSLIVTEGVIRKDGWLAASFRRHDIPMPILTIIDRELGELFDFARSQPGHRYTVTRTSSGELVDFHYRIRPGDEVWVRRTGEGYTATIGAAPESAP